MDAGDVNGGCLAGRRKSAQLAKVIDLVTDAARDEADRPPKIRSGRSGGAFADAGLSMSQGHGTRLFARQLAGRFRLVLSLEPLSAKRKVIAHGSDISGIRYELALFVR